MVEEGCAEDGRRGGKKREQRSVIELIIKLIFVKIYYFKYVGTLV